MNEAYDFDISQIIGAKVLVNVTTKYRKKDNTPYNDIGSVIPLGQYPLPPNFNPEIEYNIFGIDEQGENFKTMNYAKIPFYLKKTILESKEAKEYIAKGGVFAKMPENQQQNSQQSFQQSAPAQNFQQSAPAQVPTPAAPLAVPGEKKFVLTDTSFTLEQWKGAQWTEQMLVDNGKGYWQEPAPAPAPTQMAPPPPAPAPPAPQAPQQSFNQQPSQTTQQQEAQSWLDEEDDDDMPY